MRKEELVDAISAAHRDGGASAGGDADPGSGEAGLPGDRGPDDGRLRTGDEA